MTQLSEAANGAVTTATTGLSIFDSGTFEQMAMISAEIAKSSLIPETLKGDDLQQTTANCFRVVEQAARWGLSPFAVMDSASVVHGKLMWEGKLIAAAINQTLGVRLSYDYSGEGENRKVVVSGTLDGERLTIEGTVAAWKTTGKGSPWDRLANRDQMLAYRGARQWARRHAPEVILGVYAPDEYEETSAGGMVNVTGGRNSHIRETVIEPGPVPAPMAGDRETVGSVSTAEQEGTETERDEERAAVSKLPAKTSESSPYHRMFVHHIEATSGEAKDGRKWTRYRVSLGTDDGTDIATTFSTRVGKLAESAKGLWVMVQLEKSERGLKLTDIKPEGGLI